MEVIWVYFVLKIEVERVQNLLLCNKKETHWWVKIVFSKEYSERLFVILYVLSYFSYIDKE